MEWTAQVKRGFIKTTDHRPTNQPTRHHAPTDPPTIDSMITDPMIIFKRLDNREIIILQNTNTAEKMKNYTSIYLISI